MVWFKANEAAMAHAAAVLEHVASRSSGRVPAPLVRETDTGWMLLEDADPRLPGPHVSEELCRELAAFGIRETVHHDDLHDGDLREAARLAVRLGWVCRAVNGALPQDPARTRVRLKMFLDGKP